MTKNILIEDWKDTILDIIKEVKENDFKNDHSDDIMTEDMYEIVDQQLWETIDGCEEVIYTYRAKQICDTLDVDIFGEDEMTGERYTSWSQAAFCGIYNMIQEEISIDDMINQYLEDLITE